MADRGTYSVEEAAVVLGISRNHAYQLAQSGQIPVIRLGRRVVVPAARLHAWLAGDSAGEGEPRRPACHR